MILEKELVAFIKLVVKTAQLVDIDNIIIETDRIRAIDDNSSIAIIHTDNIPKLPFASMGLNRLKLLTSRLNVIESLPNFKINCEINKDQAISLEFTADKTKIDYRCANPASIRAPKSLKDAPLHKFVIPQEGVIMLKKGYAMMPQDGQSTNVVTLVSNKDGMFFELKDVNNDIFSFRFADQAMSTDGSSPSVFVYSFPVKVLLALFENNPNSLIYVGEKSLNIKINSFNCYVSRQA